MLTLRKQINHRKRYLTLRRALSCWPSWRSWRTSERACLHRAWRWFSRIAKREMARLRIGLNLEALNLKVLPSKASSFLPISSCSFSDSSNKASWMALKVEWKLRTQEATMQVQNMNNMGHEQGGYGLFSALYEQREELWIAKLTAVTHVNFPHLTLYFSPLNHSVAHILVNRHDCVTLTWGNVVHLTFMNWQTSWHRTIMSILVG